MNIVIYAILYHLHNYNNGWMIIIIEDHVIRVIEFYNISKIILLKKEIYTHGTS
jgi:hypothetical protein